MRLLAAAALLLLAGCHGASSGEGTTADEARRLNETADSIDSNAAAAEESGDQNGDQSP